MQKNPDRGVSSVGKQPTADHAMALDKLRASQLTSAYLAGQSIERTKKGPSRSGLKDKGKKPDPLIVFDIADSSWYNAVSPDVTKFKSACINAYLEGVRVQFSIFKNHRN